MALHFRKDSPNGITPPNPDVSVSPVDHITKARGKKTQYTSVSESEDSIRHFSGQCYRCESSEIVSEGHEVLLHADLLMLLRTTALGAQRAEKIKAERALQLATRAREALIDWKFDLKGVARKDRITHSASQIQKFFVRA
ncbi:hypothetical protein GCM10023155_06000 [Bremerella cremea]